RGVQFSAWKTMELGQRLYEGVDLGSEGQTALITYMRTDSTRVSKEAEAAARQHIQSVFGDAYLPDTPPTYRSGKSAQEAHEAIRPTDVSLTPQEAANRGLHGELLRLYTLIWNRFVASQMTPAVWAVTRVEILATPKEEVRAEDGTVAFGVFTASGRTLKFDGFRRVLASSGKQEDTELPALEENQPLDRLELIAS